VKRRQGLPEKLRVTLQAAAATVKLQEEWGGRRQQRRDEIWKCRPRRQHGTRQRRQPLKSRRRRRSGRRRRRRRGTNFQKCDSRSRLSTGPSAWRNFVTALFVLRAASRCVGSLLLSSLSLLHVLFHVVIYVGLQVSVGDLPYLAERAAAAAADSEKGLGGEGKKGTLGQGAGQGASATGGKPANMAVQRTADAQAHQADPRGICANCILIGAPFPARFAFSEVLSAFRRGAASMTCPTCDAQSDVLWLIEDYNALRACSRCRAMFVEPPPSLVAALDAGTVKALR
jgi:hypothetical protein